MVHIEPLSNEQNELLDRIRRQAVGRVSQRAHMVLLSARGYTVARIAEVFDLDEKTVRYWLRRYQRRGPRGLDDAPRPGRPPKDSLARQIIDTQVSNGPRNSGLIQNCWTVGLLAGFLAQRFGLVLSIDSVRRYLHAAGWRWARPRLAPATHAPAVQRKVDLEAPLKLRRLAQVLKERVDRTVLFLDESELQLLPVVRACWMKGLRLRVPTPGQNVKRALFGALNARTGALHHLVRPRKQAVDFIAFLECLAHQYPSGEVVLVLDNVITHAAKVVLSWLAEPEHARFRLLWLPTYAAHEHNPIERVWGLMKDAVAANRLHGSIHELVQVAERYLTTTRFQAPYPIELTDQAVLDEAA